MYKRLFLALLASLLLSACSIIDGSGGDTGSGLRPNSPAPTPTITYSALSGRVGEDGRVLAVKIDDTKQARPQIGLTDADVVYIEQVEGGVTRLAAIYSSRYPALVGPVRSARISDMELLAQYGKVAFAFSGAQRKLRPVIENANLFNLGAEREGLSVYSRDSTRRAPWNMILHTDTLFERVDKRELDVVVGKNLGWNFKKKSKLGSEITEATVRWPATKYRITWSDVYAGWLMEQDGTSKVDASGAPVVASTFIAQVVSISDSEYGDKFGGITPLVTTVGQGKVFVFRDGRVIPGTWSRATPESGTTFVSDAGDEIPFKAGQIWFALVAQEPEITYPAPPPSAQSPSATPAATK